MADRQKRRRLCLDFPTDERNERFGHFAAAWPCLKSPATSYKRLLEFKDDQKLVASMDELSLSEEKSLPCRPKK